MLEENRLTLRQLKVSQKNVVPILASARVPGDTMTFSKQSLVLCHWAALGAELGIDAAAEISSSYSGHMKPWVSVLKEHVLNIPYTLKIRLHFLLGLHLV